MLTLDTDAELTIRTPNTAEKSKLPVTYNALLLERSVAGEASHRSTETTALVVRGAICMVDLTMGAIGVPS